MSLPAESPLRIACVQMEPRIGQRDGNVARSLHYIAEAASAGARLVVLPELCNTGYVFASRAEAFALAEPLPDGPSCQAWQAAASEHGVTIVAGIAELDGGRLYNSAVLIGPSGYIGRYRKNHLWGDENLFFEPGDLGMPVFDIPVGRIACAICYDLWFPELYRLASLHGADLLCVPTNWVPMRSQPQHLPMMANMLVMAGAHSNAMFIAAADRVGVERGQRFIGNSLIVGPEGWPLAGPGAPDAEEVLIADLNLSDARRSKHLNTFNHVLRDRRTDLYGSGAGG